MEKNGFGTNPLFFYIRAGNLWKKKEAKQESNLAFDQEKWTRSRKKEVVWGGGVSNFVASSTQNYHFFLHRP